MYTYYTLTVCPPYNFQLKSSTHTLHFLSIPFIFFEKEIQIYSKNYDHMYKKILRRQVMNIQIMTWSNKEIVLRLIPVRCRLVWSVVLRLNSYSKENEVLVPWIRVSGWSWTDSLESNLSSPWLHSCLEKQKSINNALSWKASFEVINTCSCFPIVTKTELSRTLSCSISIWSRTLRANGENESLLVKIRSGDIFVRVQFSGSNTMLNVASPSSICNFLSVASDRICNTSLAIAPNSLSTFLNSSLQMEKSRFYVSLAKDRTPWSVDLHHWSVDLAFMFNFLRLMLMEKSSSYVWINQILPETIETGIF